jgi:WD40 repeat protein/serine/threonine protein kinase/tetratricopeptide (TPR) repeat protein
LDLIKLGGDTTRITHFQEVTKVFHKGRSVDEKSVFLNALNKPPGHERTAWLDDVCRNDLPLRARVDALLRQHERASHFLEHPPSELDATVRYEISTQDRTKALQAGQTTAFEDDRTAVIGSAGHSVLKRLAQSIQVPHVVLRESQAEGDAPVTRPKSPEMPHRNFDSRYRVDGEIARGGMGAILKGRDVDLGRDLAIKVLLDQHKDKPDVIQRFVEEAQIGGQLQHPGIAPIYELGQFEDERPFFAMKLVKGETLSKLLADRDDPTAERAKFIGIFEQICQTMAYAHSRGVIHRDLKPANIMVGAFGEVQVMDWGLAKVLSTGGIADERKAHEKRKGQSVIQTLRSQGGNDPSGTIGAYGSQTQMGSVMGTPAYMPPEQALGEIDILDERADVFGLGAILCEILTGQPPYVSHDSTRLFRMAARGKLDNCLLRLDASLADRELIALAKHCLAIEPADRPRDAGVLASRVTDYMESVETKLRKTEVDRAAQAARAESESRRVEQQQRSARRMRRIVAGFAIVAAIAVGASIVAGQFWQAANFAKLEAEDNLAKAQKAGREASEQRDRADEQAQLGNLRLYYAQMHQAEQVWRENQGLASMRGILTEWLPRPDSPDRRGWEWFYLNSLPFQNQDTLVKKGQNKTTVVAWHRASDRLAEGTADGLIRIWDVGRKRAMLTLKGPGSAGIWWGNRWLNWSPDGSTLAAGFNNGDVHVWESSSGRNVGLYRGHTSAIRSVAYSSDGSRMAAWGEDGKILIWDVNTGELNSAISRLGGVTVGAWSPDDKLLACGHTNGSVTISGADAGTQEVTLLGGRGSIYDLAWSPDSSQVATTNMVDMAVSIWEISSEKMVVGPLRHAHWVTSLAWESDGQRLAAGDMAHSIKIWNTTTGSLDLNLRGNTDNPTSLAWGRDGSLAAGLNDGTLKIYNTNGVPESRVLPVLKVGDLPVPGIPTTAVAWSPDGNRLVSGSDDGKIRIWDPVDRKVVLSIDGHDVGKLSPQFGLIRSLAWSSDGTRVASGGLDGNVKVWNVGDGSEVFALPNDHGPVWSVAWGPEGTQLAASYQNGTIRVVEGLNSTPKEHAFQAHEPTWLGARTLAWSPNGDSLASSGADGFVKIWDATGGIERARMPSQEAVFSIAWSPDGSRLASTDTNSLVTTWDAATAVKISTLRSHSSWVEAVVWSPDGTRLASCGLDNTVRISDPNLGEETLVLHGDTGWFHDISWHPDGAQLAAASSDGHIWIWDATRGFERDNTLRALPYIDRKVVSGTVCGDDLTWFVESYIRAGMLKEALNLLTKSEQDNTGSILLSEIIAAAALIPGLLEELAESASDDGCFQAELARHFLEQGDMEQANAARSAARTWFERRLIKEPENTSHADELANLLIQMNSGEWTTLSPVDSKSIHGANLTVQADDSILASGTNIDGDVYRISAVSPIERIVAVRLEVMPDASLPSKGPGRHESGNFHLREFRLFQVMDDSDNELSPVPLGKAWTSYIWNAPDTDIAGTIDPDLNKAWHVWGRTGEAHQAVFRLRKPVQAPTNRRFVIELRQLHTLGRFRLSVSADPVANELTAMTFTDPWAKLAAAYQIIHDQPALDKLLERHPEAAAGIGDLFAGEQNWDQAIVEYSKAISLANTVSALLAKRAAAFIATQNWDLARADWQRIVADRPDQSQAAFEAFRNVERWKEASTFGLMVVEERPDDTIAWLRVATVLALTDDRDAYSNFCRRMVQHFASSDNPETAERVIKACLLRADSIELAKLPEDRLAKSLDDGTMPEWLPPWAWGSRALLAYRRGDAESAVSYVAKSEQYTPLDTTHAMNLAVLAMAQHQLGSAIEAQAALEEAFQLITRLKGYPGSKGEHDLLIAENLFNEAKAGQAREEE